MKSALVTATIIMSLLGVIFVFERWPKREIHQPQDPEEWFLAKIEEKRQAEESIQNTSADSPATISKLIQLMADTNSSVRQEAIRELAKSGRAEVTSIVKQAFADEDEEVRAYAFYGVRASIEEDPFRDHKTSNQFKDELFDSVAALAVNDHMLGQKIEESVSDQMDRQRAILLLPLLNAQKAGAFLQRPDLFRPTNPDFHHILQSLSDAGIPLTKSIDSYIAEFRSNALAEKYPFSYFYGQLLRAAATQKHPRTHELIHDALESFRDWTVPENAAEAKWIMLGLSPTLEDDILIHHERGGPEKLEKPLQSYLLVYEYYHDSMNGGLSQYFLNSYSNNVRQNVSALKEMGANCDVYVIEQAMKLFGANGPPVNQQQRREMMYANDSKLFDLIDAIEAPEGITQKYETIVHAKLYLSKHVEICKQVPRYRE
jgi:hypothetical protein